MQLLEKAGLEKLFWIRDIPGISLLCYDWHPHHLGYLRTSSLAGGPDPVAAAGTLWSLVTFWHRQLARVTQQGKGQETLLIFPLPFFSQAGLFPSLWSLWRPHIFLCPLFISTQTWARNSRETILQPWGQDPGSPSRDTQNDMGILYT